MLAEFQRIRRMLLSTLILFTAAFGLSACSDKVPTGQLIVGIEAEPERFDPLTMKNPKNFIVSWQIFEGLLGLDDRGQVAPSIADRWESADNVTWRFHVRPGVAFHASDLFGTPVRSRPVTADDVVASYTAFCSATAYPAFLLTDSIRGCADYNAGKAKTVEGIHAIDESTVEIRLNKPEPFFLNRLTTAWIAIFPKESLDPQYDATRGLTMAVGTGPYRMVSRSSSEVVLERNPDYWGKGANGVVTRLVFRVITNDEARLAELRKGGVDLMVVPPVSYPAVFDQSGTLKADYAKTLRTKSYSTFNSHMIGINDEKVTDVHLRRAMNLGVDRRLIVQKLLYGHADVTGGTVPPGINGYQPPFAADKLFDLALAREELAKSSYKGEELELLVHELAGSEQIGQLFQDQMKTLGINVKLRKVDFNSAIGRMVKGETTLFSMFLDYVFSSPEPILINIFSSGKRPVPNFWQFSDSEIDRDLEGLRTLKSQDAVKRSSEIERRIMEQAPAVFLFRANQVALYSSRFGELSVNAHGHFRFDALKSAAAN